ncbi:MAG: precorrin-6B C5,15-methyltransferase / cobalt-precorrin-6B C5,C15-methyltransferase [Solirubrobacteraceae bacterium]|nr:precorrin-6B C5,15-methyltransferase / cobalt-precorrin-6B C5,C15-methyltransferase [Solirubrobacteraceae bacterium]
MITVVGIGADGWDGLDEPARTAVLGADLLVGGERQLALVPDGGAERRAWPKPLLGFVDELGGFDGAVCVLASGDPMLHGIGATLVRRLGPQRLRVIPHISAHAFACARLGWPAADVELVSAVSRPAEVVAPVLAPGRRLVVYVSGPGGAAEVARVARERGFGASRLVVMEELGGPKERIEESTADGWGEREAAPLHAVALEVRGGGPLLGRTPGLPDDAYEHDGQITKRDVRAITLAALVPVPGQWLWDIGAGSGSVAIEWLRAAPGARAVAIECDSARAERIARNALRLGVPSLEVVTAAAPAALDGLPAPDAIFVGGGLTADGLLERCRAELTRGGRLVANAVTVEGEGVLARAHAQWGGRLVRLAVAQAQPLGGYTAWRPAMAITQWELR